MDMLSVLLLVVFGYSMYKLGQSSVKQLLGVNVVNEIVSKTKVPIGVIEEIEGQYYVYEKDTTNFLGQATTIEEIPQMLMDRKIGLALLMYPEKSPDVYWCINGKIKVHNES